MGCVTWSEYQPKSINICVPNEHLRSFLGNICYLAPTATKMTIFCHFWCQPLDGEDRIPIDPILSFTIWVESSYPILSSIRLDKQDRFPHPIYSSTSKVASHPNSGFEPKLVSRDAVFTLVFVRCRHLMSEIVQIWIRNVHFGIF